MSVQLSRNPLMTASLHAPCLIPVKGSTLLSEMQSFTKEFARERIFTLTDGEDVILRMKCDLGSVSSHVGLSEY
jgi:hypothetical protein